MFHDHRAIWMIACVLSLVVGAPALPAHAETQQISVDELDRFLASGVTLIDVRRADEWRATGIVPGSRMITAYDSSGNLDPRFVGTLASSLPKDRPVALICRSGNRSAMVGQVLSERLGYQHVYNVEGGIQQWMLERRPVAACPSC
jgi:rhodanese-related sulfurtransferase